MMGRIACIATFLREGVVEPCVAWVCNCVYEVIDS